MSPSSLKEETRALADLIDYPQQHVYFDPLSDFALRALSADIKQNGLKEKIEILPKNKAGFPANTIISGHQRRRALLLNGEKEVFVNVRYDLAEATAEEIEKVFLECNYLRRDLDILAKMRVAYRLYKLKKRKPRGRLDGWAKVDARDEVGNAVGLSGRTLSRYFNVLEAPAEVQNALRTKQISRQVAERVNLLNDKDRAELTARLQSGQTVKKIVKDLLPKKDSRHKKPSDALLSFLKGLTKASHDLEGRLERVGSAWWKRYLPDLRKGAEFISALLTLAEAKAPQVKETATDVRALADQLNRIISGPAEEKTASPAQPKAAPGRAKKAKNVDKVARNNVVSDDDIFGIDD